MTLNRDLDHESFKVAVREQLLYQLNQTTDVEAFKLTSDSSSDQADLTPLKFALRDAEKLTLRIGEQPPQPPGFRAKMGALLVRAIRRLLFWFSPQITRANIAVIQALEQQLRLSEQVSRSLRNLSNSLYQLRHDSEQAIRESTALTQSKIDDFHKSLHRSRGLAQEQKHELDALYVDFEDEFRGSREEIHSRLMVYLPLIEERSLGTSETPILDLGCGRGEWLEMLKTNGFEARGVDSNWLMVDQCNQRGLAVAEADLISYLKSLPSESVGAVCPFHVLEHLRPEQIVMVLDETLRVLKSSGMAMFETPNPENLLVGAYTFYTDLTHRNPLPSSTLQFLLKARGFSDVHVWHLNPLPDSFKFPGDDEAVRRLNHFFYGPRDYAVIGVKPLPEGVSPAGALQTEDT